MTDVLFTIYLALLALLLCLAVTFDYRRRGRVARQRRESDLRDALGKTLAP